MSLASKCSVHPPTLPHDPALLPLTPRCLRCAASEDIGKLPFLRMTIAESMRLYPQPPILIRR